MSNIDTSSYSKFFLLKFCKMHVENTSLSFFLPQKFYALNFTITSNVHNGAILKFLSTHPISLLPYIFHFSRISPRPIYG